MRALLRGFAVAVILVMIVACGVSRQGTTTPVSPVVASATATTCDSLTPPLNAQFPAKFDYPQSATTVQSWVQNRQGDRMRLHAYCVFAGLNHPVPVVGVPTWRTWGTATQAFPYEYNPWQATGAGGQLMAAPATPVPVTMNETRSESGEKVGGPEAIVNPAPIYGVNRAIAANPDYQPCLQPIQGTNLYSLKDGHVFQSNGDIMVGTVSYNPPALQNIRSTQQLYNAAKLDAQLPVSATSPSTSIPDFPSGSIVLKVMHWPVAGGGPTGNSFTALPIWDWDANAPGSPSDGQYAGYEMQKFWTDAVAISSGPVTSPGQTRTVQFLYGVLSPPQPPAPPPLPQPLGPNTYQAQVVGLDRFYSKTYTAAGLAALSPCDRAILDASAYWTYNRAFQAGDSLALVAMHIMTKEQSGWTFQSAWWHPDALACTSNSRFCSDQPASVPGGDTTWKNYMMVTTYGQTQQQQKPNYYAPSSTVGPVWPVAYNPYIELAASHPITTNCINCHHRAAWPPADPQQKPDRGRSSTYLQDTPANPNALETFDASNGVFNGLLMLDSMWGVSDRAGYPTSRNRAAAKAESPSGRD